MAIKASSQPGTISAAVAWSDVIEDYVFYDHLPAPIRRVVMYAPTPPRSKDVMVFWRMKQAAGYTPKAAAKELQRIVDAETRKMNLSSQRG